MARGRAAPVAARAEPAVHRRRWSQGSGGGSGGSTSAGAGGSSSVGSGGFGIGGSGNSGSGPSGIGGTGATRRGDGGTGSDPSGIGGTGSDRRRRDRRTGISAGPGTVARNRHRWLRAARSGGGGCACDVGSAGGSSGTLLFVGLVAAVSGFAGDGRRRAKLTRARSGPRPRTLDAERARLRRARRCAACALREGPPPGLICPAGQAGCGRSASTSRRTRRTAGAAASPVRRGSSARVGRACARPG